MSKLPSGSFILRGKYAKHLTLDIKHSVAKALESDSPKIVARWHGPQSVQLKMTVPTGYRVDHIIVSQLETRVNAAVVIAFRECGNKMEPPKFSFKTWVLLNKKRQVDLILWFTAVGITKPTAKSRKAARMYIMRAARRGVSKREVLATASARYVVDNKWLRDTVKELYETGQ